jgi:hypothetical protein
MKLRFLFVLFIAILMVSGCASVKVKTDFDPEYDFASFKTYRWAAGEELNPNDALAQNTLVRNRVVDSVERVMMGKGFTKVVAGEADLVIVMHAGSKERMQVSQTYTGPRHYRGRYPYHWYDPWWGPYGGTTSVSYYTEGTLVIDMVAWETKELAWRGMGTKTVRDYKDTEKQQAAIDKSVAKILADFPPK